MSSNPLPIYSGTLHIESLDHILYKYNLELKFIKNRIIINYNEDGDLFEGVYDEITPGSFVGKYYYNDKEYFGNSEFELFCKDTNTFYGFGQWSEGDKIGKLFFEVSIYNNG